MDGSCNSYKTDLSALIDGQLDNKSQSDLHTHLDNCGPCSQELENLKGLHRFLGNELAAEKLPIPDIWGLVQSSMPSLCSLMQEDLSAYLDGELPPAAQEGVNRHLKECQDCLANFKLLNDTNRLLNKAFELPANIKVDLWPAVKAQLNEDCALIHTELTAYADMEVVPLRHRSITTHIMNCLECRDQFNSLSAIGDIIRDSYKPQIPDNFDLWPEIRSKMAVVPFVAKTAPEAAKPKVVRPRIIAGAAAAAIIGLLGILFTFATPRPAGSETMNSETYLIQSALQEPSDLAEAVVYEQQ